MKDIVPELLEKIEREFDEKITQSKMLGRILNLIKEGKATYKEANEYAIEAGEILASVFKKNISSEVLPDGKMYFNIADRILNPTMNELHHSVSSVSADIQTELNHSANLGIKGIEPPVNQDRIDGLVNRLSCEDHYDDVAWMLDENVINFSQSVVDDTIKTNSEFHAKSGLRPKIIRRSTGHCCDWCNAVAGTYSYPDVPKDVYRRHRFCKCTVEYDPGNGAKRTNVHTKQISGSREDKTAQERINEFQRKQLELNKPKSSGPYVEKAIQDGEIKDEINYHKQLRHTQSESNGKSYIFGDIETANHLYNKYKCNGQAILSEKGWTKKERVYTEEPVGVYITRTGEKSESSTLIIGYSKTGSHLYPGRPKGE